MSHEFNIKLEKEYSVQKILNKRTRHGRTEYLLKWNGYSEFENTWEPLENLSNCTELVAEFESKKKNQQERERKRSQSSALTVTSGASSAADTNSSVAGPSSFAAGPPLSKASPSKEVKNTSFIANKNCVQPIRLERSDDEIERTVDGEQNDVSEKQINDVSLVPIDWPSQRVAEKIIGSTTDAKGVLVYFIKWQGTDEADLIFAREAHKMCPQIVINFYEERIKWEPIMNKDNSAVGDEQVNGVSLVPIDWPSQRVAEKIIGSTTDAEGVLVYFIEWQGTDEADLIYAREAHKMCPQIIIDFYQKKIEWKHSSSKDNSATQCVPRDTADDSADED
ncbi:chromobox protein 1-like [Aphis craccivora]|uniref:Chromobox protein 1-like n=1 Tax=Aphis craccivora TaxID=307492 RepID=A0A6G0YCG5_APHCR|nr:chromobox protein 1-like [Aphis craccivora]